MYSLLPLKLVDTQLVTNDTSAVVFLNVQAAVPPGTQHLVVTTSGYNSSGSSLYGRARINGVTGDSYSRQSGRITGNTLSNLNQDPYNYLQPAMELSSTAGEPLFSALFMPWAFKTDRFKTVLSLVGQPGVRITHSRMDFRSTAAVDRIDLLPFTDAPFTSNLIASGSIFRLWAVDEQYNVKNFQLAEEGDVVLDPCYTAGPHLLTVTGCRSNSSGTAGSRLGHVINGESSPTGYLSQYWNGEGGTTTLFRGNIRRCGWLSSDGLAGGHVGGGLIIYPFYRKNDRQIVSYDNHGAFDQTWAASSLSASMSGQTGPMGSLTYDDIANGDALTAISAISQYRPKSPVASQKVSSATNSITLQVPPEEGPCVFVISGRSELEILGDPVDYDGLLIAINGDTTAANYDAQLAGLTNTSMVGSTSDSRRVGVIPSDNSDGGVYGGGTLEIAEYARDDREKAMLFFGGVASNGRLECNTVRWESDSPVQTVTFTTESGEDFKPGTIIELYLPGRSSHPVASNTFTPPTAVPSPVI